MVQSVKNHLQQTTVGNTVDGSEIPNNHTTWDVQFLENHGINYQPQLVFSPEFYNQQYLGERLTFFLRIRLRPSWPELSFWGPFVSRKPTETLQTNAADQGNDLLEVFYTAKKTCDTTIRYEILTVILCGSKALLHWCFESQNKTFQPHKIVFQWSYGAPIFVKLWGPYLDNYRFLSPPTFVHKPHDHHHRNRGRKVGRSRVAIPLDRSLTPSANIAIPAKVPYPPGQLTTWMDLKRS